MIESLIFPSCPAAAHARLIAATLALGSRPSTSPTKADFDGPVSPSRPLSCDRAPSAFDAPLLPFGDDLALLFVAGPASASVVTPFVPRFPVSPSLERTLSNRLSLIVPSFPAAFHARLTASRSASRSPGRNPSRNAVLP